MKLLHQNWSGAEIFSIILFFQELHIEKLAMMSFEVVNKIQHWKSWDSTHQWNCSDYQLSPYIYIVELIDDKKQKCDANISLLRNHNLKCSEFTKVHQTF